MRYRDMGACEFLPRSWQLSAGLWRRGKQIPNVGMLVTIASCLTLISWFWEKSSVKCESTSVSADVYVQPKIGELDICARYFMFMSYTLLWLNRILHILYYDLYFIRFLSAKSQCCSVCQSMSAFHDKNQVSCVHNKENLFVTSCGLGGESTFKIK